MWCVRGLFRHKVAVGASRSRFLQYRQRVSPAGACVTEAAARSQLQERATASFSVEYDFLRVPFVAFAVRVDRSGISVSYARPDRRGLPADSFWPCDILPGLGNQGRDGVIILDAHQ